MSVIKVGAIQDLSGNTDFDLVNNIVNTTTLNVSTISGVTLSVPAGTIIHVASSTPPTGFIKANGAAISRSTYSALFSYIGTTFGSGDGSTTFNVPDLRGRFVRGFDDGAGVDSGRTFGSAQADAFASHTHNLQLGGASYYSGYSTLAVRTDTFVANIDSGATGGTETRPKNIALLACIKF